MKTAKARLLGILLLGALGGCSNKQKLADDEANFQAVVAAQQATLKRQLQDSILDGMIERHAISRHDVIVFYECRDNESTTPTCVKLYKRIDNYGKKMAAENNAQLKEDGVTR